MLGRQQCGVDTQVDFQIEHRLTHIHRLLRQASEEKQLLGSVIVPIDQEALDVAGRVGVSSDVEDYQYAVFNFHAGREFRDLVSRLDSGGALRRIDGGVSDRS
jgi:hypothetical protein